jgi:hypothetical protein
MMPTSSNRVRRFNPRNNRALKPGQIRRGVCRYCRCTSMRGCVLGMKIIEGHGADLPWGWVNTCSWIDELHTVCSAPACVEKYRTEQSSSGLTGGTALW